MGDLMDAPNQQAVRADGSGPWEEGDGGSTLEPTPTRGKAKAAKDDKAEPETKPEPEQVEG